MAMQPFSTCYTAHHPRAFFYYNLRLCHQHAIFGMTTSIRRNSACRNKERLKTLPPNYNSDKLAIVHCSRTIVQEPWLRNPNPAAACKANLLFNKFTQGSTNQSSCGLGTMVRCPIRLSAVFACLAAGDRAAGALLDFHLFMH
eukprot:949960-Amphidinium_carterae.1